MSAMTWAGVALLGGVGAVLRLLAVARWEGLPGGNTAAVATINTAGALALGAIVGAGVSGDDLTLMAGGLLGSFTTFSAWVADADELRRRGSAAAVTLALGAPLLTGLLAVAAGRALF